MIKNKKAMEAQKMGEAWFALIVILIGLIIMFSMTSSKQKSKEYTSQSFVWDAHAKNLVALYLKQPLEINGLSLTMADLIVLTAENSYYENVWVAETKSFLEKTPLKVEIECEGGKNEFKLDYTSSIWKQRKKESVSFFESIFEGFVRDKLFASVIRLPSHSSTTITFTIKVNYEVEFGGKYQEESKGQVMKPDEYKERSDSYV